MNIDPNNNGTNPYLFALSCISGKWKASLIHHIHHYGAIRFSETKRTFPISEKVLSQQLKELVADGLVQRIQFNEIPLRVEYHLTPTGEALVPALDFLYIWSVDRMTELDIKIDPDAFIVHTEDKYTSALNNFMDNFDAVCDTMTWSVNHNISPEKILEILKEYTGIDD